MRFERRVRELRTEHGINLLNEAFRPDIARAHARHVGGQTLCDVVVLMASEVGSPFDSPVMEASSTRQDDQHSGDVSLGAKHLHKQTPIAFSHVHPYGRPMDTCHDPHAAVCQRMGFGPDLVSDVVRAVPQHLCAELQGSILLLHSTSSLWAARLLPLPDARLLPLPDAAHPESWHDPSPVSSHCRRLSKEGLRDEAQRLAGMDPSALVATLGNRSGGAIPKLIHQNGVTSPFAETRISVARRHPPGDGWCVLGWSDAEFMAAFSRALHADLVARYNGMPPGDQDRPHGASFPHAAFSRAPHVDLVARDNGMPPAETSRSSPACIRMCC